MKHKEEADLVFTNLSGRARSSLKWMLGGIKHPPKKVTHSTIKELESAGLGKWYDGPTFNIKTGEAKDRPDPGTRYFVLTTKGKRVGKFA